VHRRPGRHGPLTAARLGQFHTLSQWNTADSTMRAYEGYCTAAVTCRTLSDLRRFIERLD